MSDTQNLYAPTIPEAVRRQGARSDELIRAAQEAPEGADPAITTVVGDTPVPSPGEQPAGPTEQPAGQTIPAPSPTTEPAKPVDDWEQRYRTLQGKYNADIGDLRGQINGMQAVLANFQHTRPDPAPTPAQPAAASLITQADADEFGADLLEVVRRVARSELQPELDAVRRTVAEVQGTAQTTRTQVSESAVHAALDADPQLAGVWRGLNTDPDFLAWLNEADVFSGQLRINLLRQAHESGDASRTASFFKSYIAEHTLVAPQPQPAPHTPEPGTGRPTLADLAGPGRGSAPSNPGAPDGDKRIWTQKEISDFYQQVTRGAFAGRDAEKARLEQDIYAAGAEGRIR